MGTTTKHAQLESLQRPDVICVYVAALCLAFFETRAKFAINLHDCLRAIICFILHPKVQDFAISIIRSGFTCAVC